VQQITTDNILDLDFDEMRRTLFSLIRTHSDSLVLDRDLYVQLLGEYAALYQYYSELYTFLIGKVRDYAEARAPFRKQKAMDKRDCLEQVLKCAKFEYESLSRKVTILSGEGQE
jgi:hypothetical protein